ncbi:MAG TPA: hypothetical protein VFF89_02625 [Sphingobium sp.]|nr:hypothetical protein [Sphingobium sp.]
MSARRLGSSLLALPLLAGCARQTAQTVAQGPDTPGFLLGLWHGFIFPIAWLVSLFVPEVAIYAVPNTGGWYDFGYFVGIVFLGVGAQRTRTVTRTIYVERRRERP